MARTKITIPAQARVNENLDVTMHKIVNLADPVDDYDAVNYKTFKILEDEVSGTAGQIGVAEDGTYTDGLFTDFVETTPTGTAVDRFNEVLKALSPSPAPNLSSISFQDTGVAGNLSFGTSNPISGYEPVSGSDVNDLYSTSGNAEGIFDANTTMNGTIADNVSNPDDSPYHANSFGDADQGNLKLMVNGTEVSNVDLTSTSSSIDTSSGGTATGFNLSQVYNAKFESGQELDVFKHRTGTWYLAPAQQQNGYNTVQVVHTVGGSDRNTQTFNFVVDDSTTATTFSGESLGSLNMTGSNQLSGVTYHTGGTASYDLTVSNAYLNTYSSSSSAVTHGTTNCSAASGALDPINTGGGEDHTKDYVISGKTVTVSSSSRLFDGSISIDTEIQRTIQSDATSTGVSIGGILLDATSPSATDSLENFDDEGYRMHNGVESNLDDTTYGSGSGQSNYTWDSSQNLDTGDANHNDGLLIAGGALSYPSNTGHISGITDGNFDAPANAPSNPNYSTASGDRTYIRYFYDSNSRSNFRLDVDGNNINFVDVATGPSGNNLTLEVLAPDTTQDESGTIEWKDAMVAYSGSDDDIGCYAGTYGNSPPGNWGITLGTRNTSTSGNVIVIRITAAAGWTGYLSSIDLTWL